MSKLKQATFTVVTEGFDNVDGFITVLDGKYSMGIYREGSKWYVVHVASGLRFGYYGGYTLLWQALAGISHADICDQLWEAEHSERIKGAMNRLKTWQAEHGMKEIER